MIELVVTAFTVVYLGAIYLYWKRLQSRRERRHEHEKSFVKILFDGVRNGTISTLADSEIIFRAHFESTAINLRTREQLSRHIRQAVLGIASLGNVATKTDLSNTLPQLKQLLKENELIVQVEEKRVPFEGTPSPERQLLEDVLELTASDRDVVRSKLTELARAVSARHETIIRLGDEGKQSLKWAKYGLIGTVIFSLISISLGLWTIYK